MFSFLTLLMLPVQSKVSIAFVYWDCIEGSEQAGTSSWSPLHVQSQQQCCKPALSKAAPCMGTSLVCQMEGHISLTAAGAQHTPVLARQKVGRNFWPTLSCSNRKGNAATLNTWTQVVLQDRHTCFSLHHLQYDKLISLQSPFETVLLEWKCKCWNAASDGAQMPALPYPCLFVTRLQQPTSMKTMALKQRTQRLYKTQRTPQKFEHPKLYLQRASSMLPAS